MKLVDANVLLHAVNTATADHRTARQWLDGSLSRGVLVGFDWVALLAFLRLSTRPGIFGRPLSAPQATSVVDAWLGAPSARVLSPGPRHLRILGDLLASAGTAGNLVNDAHLAALALEHGAEVVTFDADFDRFLGLRWSRPMAADPGSRRGRPER